MNHLYEDKAGMIHSCESAKMVDNYPSTKLVWTKCGKDVPANKSFRSHELPTCKCCTAAKED